MFNIYKKYLCLVILQIDAFLLAIRSVIGFSFFEQSPFFSYMTTFIWATIFFVILVNNYKLKDLFIVFLFILLSLIVGMRSSFMAPFYTSLFIVAVRDFDLKKIIKSNLYGVIISTLVVVVSYWGGFIETKLLDGGNSLGFVNPNILSMEINVIVFFIIYLKYRKLNFFDFTFLILLSIVTFYVTKCRTGGLVNIGIIILTLILKISKFAKSIFTKYLITVCVALAVISILGLFLCELVPFFIKLNEILSGRFVQPQYYLLQYGIHPFGTYLEEFMERKPGSLTPTLDEGYIRLLLQFGFVYFGFFLWMNWKSIKIAKKNNCIEVQILLFASLLGLVAESMWMTVNYNFSLLCCSLAIFYHKENHKNV